MNTTLRELAKRGGRLALIPTGVLVVALLVGAVDGGSEIGHGDIQRGDTSEMKLIPAGEFFMGSDTDGDHSPVHQVLLDSFYLDAHEVTNAEYSEFCRATGHRLPEFWGIDGRRSGLDFPNHPVVGVSWQDASDYSAWRGKRLPTEAEWEYAARGGLVGRNFPLRDTLSPEDANFGQSGNGGPVEIGTYAPNGMGFFDMSGNVFEWTADRYGVEYYAQSQVSNPQGPETGRFRVIRGGGWHSGPFCNRTYYRNALPPNWVDFAVGFRCAMDAGGRPAVGGTR